MELVFSPDASANVESYRDSDPGAWSLVQPALRAIRDEAARAKETELRLPGGTAWSIRCQATGIDTAYEVIWAVLGQTRIANVVYAGPALEL
jgi:hypothetical protein